MKRQRTVNRLVLILIPVIVGLLWLGTMTRQGDHPPVPDTPPDPVSREVVFHFTLRNTTNRPVSDSRFHVYVPVQQTDVQQCTGITASHPFELSTDAAGHQRLVFSFSPIAPYGIKQVSIRAQVSMRPTPWTDAPDDPGLFAAPDPALACSDQIRQLAGSLKGASPKDTAIRINGWINTHLRYSGYSREEKGACYALAHRQGDCTEFAALFVALSRAAGVPARQASGFHTTGSVLKASDVHDWAEFFDGGVWRLADPQRNVVDDQYPDYIITRIAFPSPAGKTPSRFHQFKSEGDGLIVKME